MRHLYYYYKNDGTLVVRYKDDDRRITINYLYYSLKEALQNSDAITAYGTSILPFKNYLKEFNDVKKDKEITIYDNFYDPDRENDTRKYLFDDFAEEHGWNSPDDIPDKQVWNEIDAQDRIQWDDVRNELDAMFEKNVYLLTGTCGRWNGPVQGGKFIRSVGDLLSCMDHLDYIRIYDKNGHLYIHGSHHDGDDDYELKRLTHKGYELADLNYFACDRQLHTAIMNCNFYSALPRYAQKVYGL